MDVDIISIRQDNYTYVVHCDDEAIVIDPGESVPVLDHLTRTNTKLSAILLTHHHRDHTDGVASVQASTGAHVIGPNDPRLPTCDRIVGHGDTITVGRTDVQVIATPGHTRHHVVFFIPEDPTLFSGDALFAAGCGRLFEGDATDLADTCQRLAMLPQDTLIYPGHEYTVDNLEFAASLEPGHPHITEALRQARESTQIGRPTIPVRLRDELTYNPFLRPGDPSIQKALNFSGQDAITVLAELRRRKDRW